MPLYFCLCDRRTSSSVKKNIYTIFQLDYNHLNKLTGSQVEEFVIEGCVFLGTFSTYVQHPQKKDKGLLVSLLT